MLAQQRSHTEPSSGDVSGALQAAHGGSNNAATARLAEAFAQARQAPSPKSQAPLRDVRKFDASRAAPEPIEPVEVASLLGEDVDDEVEVVEQDPLGAGVALHQ